MANDIFAKRIRQLRESKGMGVRQLAAELGIGNSSLSNYENCNRIPDIYTCKKFADYFSVSCGYLIGTTDDPNRKD
jgi:transcriptional regulator with XRE-family HTH domain